MLEAEDGKFRLSALVSRAKSTVDAVLCTSPENIYYFSGFRTTLYTRFTAVLIKMDQPEVPLLIVSTIDRQLIEDRIWSPPWGGKVIYHGPDRESDISPSPAAALKPYLDGVKRLGVDSLNLSEVDVITRAAIGIEFVQVVDLIHEIRKIKSEHEIKNLRQANQMAMMGIEMACTLLESLPITELEIATRLESDARLSGADGFGYPTLVSCGKKITALHSPALLREVEPHQPIRIAFGPSVHGYTADVVRTLCIGKPPMELIRMNDGFQIAQDQLLQMIRPGVSISAMLTVVEDIYTNRGLLPFWRNSIGHSVGLSVHETPRIAFGSESTLVEGMVVAVEPGLISPGFGGFWHCDIVVVRDSGSELISPEYQGIIVVE